YEIPRAATLRESRFAQHEVLPGHGFDEIGKLLQGRNGLSLLVSSVGVARGSAKPSGCGREGEPLLFAHSPHEKGGKRGAVLRTNRECFARAPMDVDLELGVV